MQYEHAWLGHLFREYVIHVHVEPYVLKQREVCHLLLYEQGA